MKHYQNLNDEIIQTKKAIQVIKAINQFTKFLELFANITKKAVQFNKGNNRSIKFANADVIEVSFSVQIQSQILISLIFNIYTFLYYLFLTGIS